MIQIYFKITATVRPVYTDIDSVPCDGYGFLFRSLQHICTLYRYVFSSVWTIQICCIQYWSNYTDIYLVPCDWYRYFLSSGQIIQICIQFPTKDILYSSMLTLCMKHTVQCTVHNVHVFSYTVYAKLYLFSSRRMIHIFI